MVRVIPQAPAQKDDAEDNCGGDEDSMKAIESEWYFRHVLLGEVTGPASWPVPIGLALLFGIGCFVAGFFGSNELRLIVEGISKS